MTELPFVLHLGKSQEILKSYPDNHFDSVVCDPPYHLTSSVKRFGKADAAPAQFGTDGAFARASRGFMGSGSTGKAAMLEWFRFVGIDMTEEYHRIAEARIRHALRQVQPKPEPEQNTKANEQLQLFAGAL